MTTLKHGEVAWNDTSFTSGEERQNTKDTFLKLVPGSNILRILSLPFQYYQHKYKFEGEKNWGHRIMCSGAHGSCPVCAKGDKPKRRWLIGVIDRKTNSYRILDIGWSILKSLQTYTRDEDWGDPSKYDVDIVVDPNGGPQGYYSLVAKPAKPLSANDLLLRDKMDMDELTRRSTPPSPDKVEERFQKLMEEFLQTPEGTNVSTSSASSVEEDEFPDYDASKQKTVRAPF